LVERASLNESGDSLLFDTSSQGSQTSFWRAETMSKVSERCAEISERCADLGERPDEHSGTPARRFQRNVRRSKCAAKRLEVCLSMARHDVGMFRRRAVYRFSAP
jgi:hypothetical protein